MSVILRNTSTKSAKMMSASSSRGLPESLDDCFIRKEESYLVRCISAVKFNEPHVMSSYLTFPISKVLGPIAAINPTMTAGIPGGKRAKEKKKVVFSPIILRILREECFVDFNSIKGGKYTYYTFLLLFSIRT